MMIVGTAGPHESIDTQQMLLMWVPVRSGIVAFYASQCWQSTDSDVSHVRVHAGKGARAAACQAVTMHRLRDGDGACLSPFLTAFMRAVNDGACTSWWSYIVDESESDSATAGRNLEGTGGTRQHLVAQPTSPSLSIARLCQLVPSVCTKTVGSLHDGNS